MMNAIDNISSNKLESVSQKPIQSLSVITTTSVAEMDKEKGIFVL